MCRLHRCAAFAAVLFLTATATTRGQDVTAGNGVDREATIGAEADAQALIARQRDLFAILLGDDRSELAYYIEVDFSWGNRWPATMAANGRMSQLPADPDSRGHFSFLAGFTPRVAGTPARGR